MRSAEKGIPEAFGNVAWIFVHGDKGIQENIYTGLVWMQLAVWASVKTDIQKIEHYTKEWTSLTQNMVSDLQA